MTKSYKKNIKNRALFGILFILIFSSAFINAFGYPNDLSINDPNDYETLPENLNGNEDFQLRGTGSYASATSGSGLFDYSHENGYDITIPNYDYAGTTVELYPKYYYLDSTSHSTFSYTDSTYKEFDSATYDAISDIRSRANRITYTTRPNDISIRGVTLQSRGWGTGNIYNEEYVNPDYKSLLQDNDLDFAVLHTYSNAVVDLIGQQAHTESTIDICIEIENTDHNLDYDLAWEYINYVMKVTLNGKNDVRIAYGYEAWFQAGIMWRSGTTDTFEPLFERHEVASTGSGYVVITGDEVLTAVGSQSCPRQSFPSCVGDTYTTSYNREASWSSVGVSPLTIANMDAFSEYYYDDDHGNPMITIRLYAHAWHGWWLARSRTSLNIYEFDSGHEFRWNRGSGSPNRNDDAYYYLDDSPSTHYNLYDGASHRAGWSNRYNIDADNDIQFRTDPLDSYETVSARIEYIKAYHYLSQTTTRNSLSFVGIPMTRESNKWRLYFPDLDTSSVYSLVSDHAYIDMLLSITGWDSGWGSYIGFIWSYSLSFEEFAYNSMIPYTSGSGSVIFGESGYYRHIDINWNEIVLTDAYINTLLINSIPQTITPEFQSYTGGDVPQWRTAEGISIDWGQGTGGVSMNIDITTDITVPIITDYSTVASIEDDEPFEFYVTGTDEVNIMEAFFILEDTSTLVRSAIPLDFKTGNTYNHINEYGDIIPSTYLAWYGLQDDAGNWQTTPSFSLEVIPAEIVIYDVSVEDYEFGTTGHYLSFRITNTNPKDYWVYIDTFLVEFGQWTLDTLISVSIDGYGIDVHDIEIIANDQNLIEGTYDTSFRVYQTPIFNSVPSDNTYVDIYGNFDLIWDISDNNLDNYTLLRDSSPIYEDDFTSPTHQILTFTEDTNLLTITTHTYLLIVRDGEGREIQDSVDITIIPYESPIIIFHHPDYTYTEDPTLQLIQIEVFSIPEVPIVAVNWDLRHSADPFNWKSLVYNSGNDRWEANFDPMIYERGDYELWIEVVDPFLDTSAYQVIQLDQMLPYYFIDTDISRTTSNIFVSENGDDSDEINAYISVIHNIVVKERNFEIYLPVRYDDAFDYYLMRGFTRYEPELIHSTGYYTEWRLSTYQATDIIYFQLQKPYITNEAVVGGLGGSYEMDFTLTSKYSFSDLTIHNTFNHYFMNPEDYEFTLMYLFGVEWYEVEDLDVQYSNMVEIQFDWASIEDDTTVEFKIIAKPLVQIYDVILNDHTYLSTGNLLNFTIKGGEPDIYNVTIDNVLVDFGSWIVDQTISINIDGYDRGIHNVTIYANDTLGTNDIYEGTFGVYEYPVFLSKPSDSKYVDIYGEFELFWDIVDNSLKNYTLLLDNIIIEEGTFINPLHDNVSYIDDTTTLSIQIHNYSLIVRDNEGLIVQDDVLIEIITYQSPIIDIIKPDEAIIIDITNQLIQVNVSSIPEVPIAFIQWDVKQSPDPFSWESLTYNIFSELWEDTFNPLNYEYGDYELWVKVIDPFDNTTEYISFALHQLIPYYYTLFNTSRTSTDIVVSYISSSTTDIYGEVIVNHDLIVKEHDFEIYIPLTYDDAFDYSLVRGFDVYYPSNFFTTSRYTLWNLPNYQPTDTVNFYLEKPFLTNDIIEVDYSGKITQEFSLYSKHSFENITIHNKIEHLVSFPDRYVYSLYYYYGGEWVQIDNNSYSILLGSFIEFDLEWDNINDDQTILFKYEAVPIQEPVLIEDLECNDYEFETIGNKISFTLYHEFPNEYFVIVDSVVIATGTYTNGQFFEISIDGYDIGLHNVTIRADSYFGITTEINTTFRVYQTPVFLSKPSSALFVELYGDFILIWEIVDNGLINYTLLHNNNIVEEFAFSDPLHAIISLTNNTQTLGVGLHNYTLIVRDNDTLIIQDVVLIQIISYILPSIDIIEPDEAIITDISPQLIECNITSMPEVPIVSVQWDLKRINGSFNWEDMAFNGITYESYFNPLDYEYGDYELWINITDLFTSVSSLKEIRLEQFVLYTIEELDITRKSSDINVGLYDDDTTDIVAYFQISHHPIAMERDFGIEIPNIYSDAYDYYINRAFDRYEPIVQYSYGTYTEWHLPTFQLEDVVYFELEKPTLRNDEVVTKDDGTIEIEFTLNSKHAFTNLTIHNTVTYYFSDVSLYTYSLSYQFGGEWYDLNSTDYLFEFDAFISFELYWDEIGSDSSIVFRFQASPKPEEVSPINWVVAGIFVPIGLFFWLLFAGVVGRKWEDWGVPRFILYSGIVAGASFGIGVLVGFLIQGSIYAILIPT